MRNKYKFNDALNVIKLRFKTRLDLGADRWTIKSFWRVTYLTDKYTQPLCVVQIQNRWRFSFSSCPVLYVGT